MSWLAPLVLILAQGPAAGAPAKPVDPKVAAQVPIIAGKLQQWQGTWGAAKGKLGCKTMRSSGDAEIDRIGCEAVIACVKPVYPELKAIADGAGAEADKKKRMAAKLATLEGCMKLNRGQGIAALALKRGAT